MSGFSLEDIFTKLVFLLKQLPQPLEEMDDRFNGVSTKYLQHYSAWFRYIDSEEYENTTSDKKNMLVKSCLFTVTDTNAKLRLSAYSC
ncbi:hypothetical protein QD46_07535 [Paenibacillus polymyxa]|nr:hypothetical protein QD46_07535 [Paenibacillus polymyxa]